MLAGTLFGTLTPVIAIGPSVLAVFNAPTTSKWPNIGIASAMVVVMLVISVIGIRISARTQVGIGVVEYLILIVFAVCGLTWVLGHHAGTMHISAAWFSLHGIGGQGSLVTGFLITVFMYSSWDGTLYVTFSTRRGSTSCLVDVTQSSINEARSPGPLLGASRGAPLLRRLRIVYNLANDPAEEAAMTGAGPR